jgi:hypothetical protein
MTTLEDIEKTVTQLPADQLAKFRAWFEEFEAARFDRRIERDAKAGRLDKLAEQALADFRATSRKHPSNIRRLFVIPAKAGIQGQGFSGCPGPPLSRG